jgi:hypothetical protein
MLEIRPICENCGKNLPNESNDAMICSFECTFCIDCVTGILQNVCPNCGGGFERRPTRPTECVTRDCLENYPVKTEKRFRPVDLIKFERLKNHYQHYNPRRR